ncbi:MAG: CehA/McbA family metallohydrolase [Pseudohongiella sp.]|nr:CehA/McbA family metallohydrolase [Pseudohongiella sp.]
MIRDFIARLALVLVLLNTQLAIAAESPDTALVLTGQLTGADHESYKEVTFDVPAGVKRITVSVTYDRDNRTVVDLGIFDPDRFRGWSGGNKATFTLAETDATPSYLPGPLPAGQWTLILGIPNIRADSVANFRAEVLLEFGMTAGSKGFSAVPLRADAGWYRGELHTHTAHSDGSCLRQSGSNGPCPVYKTVEAAVERGLDFVAVTEHNTLSHHQSLNELQMAFDQTVLMSGREITTFYGHANIFGTTEFIDFRVRDNQINSVLQAASALGAFVSINHPGLPSGEVCMGCGWIAETDYSLIDAVEVVNGSVMDSGAGLLKSPLSGIPFWENLLNAGHKVTAIAGSDNHNADLRSDSGRRTAIGEVTTVIFANSLSQHDLLEGLRRGRAFIDLEGSADRLLEIRAEADGKSALMGEMLEVAAGGDIRVTISARNTPDATVALYHNGELVSAEPDYVSTGELLETTIILQASGQSEWLRAEVVSPEGKVLLMSNAVYVNFLD